MSDRTQGQKAALAAAREKARRLADENKILQGIVDISNMKYFAQLIQNSRQYFGGIFDQLDPVSKLLTAIAWEEYPNDSLAVFLNDVKSFSPELGNIFNQYGVQFALVAPNEIAPAMSQAWQLSTFGELQEFEEKPEDTQKLRVYSLELFGDDINSYRELWLLYEDYKTEIEKARDEFSNALISETLTTLHSKYHLSLGELILYCNQLINS